MRYFLSPLWLPYSLGWLSVTRVTAADVPKLMNGDIVFQTSGSGQSLAILLASHSSYTHMGIVELAANGTPMVLEAVGPVKLTPLDEWINRGQGGRITIKRVSNLTAEQAKSALRAAHVYDGRPYDLFFLPGKDAIYCSELVRLAFTEGPRVALGKVQKVAELSINNFAAQKLIKRRWPKYPLCSAGKVSSFEDCLKLLLQQELVTPISIASDPKLEIVYSNFGPFTE